MLFRSLVFPVGRAVFGGVFWGVCELRMVLGSLFANGWGCVGLLVEGTGACVLVDETGSCLFGGQDRVRWCVLGCL